MFARRQFVPLAILLCLTPALTGAATPDEPLFPILESGIGVLDVAGERSAIEFSITAAGPVVALQPLAARLGGRVETVPLDEGRQLTINQTTYVFGPQSQALTIGERIVDLSQPPLVGGVGILVPLDLLRQTYGDPLGYEFRWSAGERRLSVERLPPRELRMDFDAIDTRGVTTLVFEFPTRPRYRLERFPGQIRIDFTGDRVRPVRPRSLAGNPLIEDLRIEPTRIRIELKRGARARDYVLEEPFRLVFDVFRGDEESLPARPAAPRSARRSPGIDLIVIDPGHGGSDTGAQGGGGSLEKNLTLILARALERQLEARLPVRVVLTRTDDVELPLDTRSALANQQKADLFISIHLNSFFSAGATGAETYFLSLEASDERAALAAEAENREVAALPDPEGDPLQDLQLILWDLAQTHYLSESQRLARLIQEELNVTLDLRNRGVKQAPFKVLMGAAMPAVLVELGFLTNPGEEQRLNDPSYRAELVETLVRAVARYRAAREGGTADSSEAFQ